MNKKVLIALAIAALAVIAVVVLSIFKPTSIAVGTSVSDAGEEVAQVEKVRPSIPESASQSKSRQRYASAERKRPTKKPERVTIEDDDDDELTDEEEAFIDEIYESLNNENLEEAIRLSEKALKSDRTEIREAMVDTLGWFGSDALAELTPYLGDDDEDIRFEALAQWQNALYEIKDEEEKASVMAMTMTVIDNFEALEEIADEFNGMDEKIAISTICDVVAVGTASGKKAAKLAYEYVTGDDFTTAEDAEKWLAENYEEQAK